MLKLLFLLALFTSIACLSNKLNTRRTRRNKCKNIEYEIPNFQKERLYGNWYILNRTDNIPFYTGCNTIRLSEGQNKTGLDWEILQRQGNTNTTIGIAHMNNTINPNSFNISFRGIEGIKTFMGTDYDNYAVVFTCNKTNAATKYLGVLLSRNKTMDKELLKSLIAIMRKRFPETHLVPVDQSNC